MRCGKIFWFCLALAGWFAGAVQAQTYIEFEFDGQKMMGRPVKPLNDHIQIAPQKGGPTTNVPWGRLSQATLRNLMKVKGYEVWAVQFIEPPPQAPPSPSNKVAIVIKPVERAPRYTSGSLLASPVTWFVLLLLYAANIYAGYEIAMFRSRNKVMVAGVCAIAPVLGPIIFLALPTHLEPVDEEALAEAEAPAELLAIPVSEEQLAADQAADEAAASGKVQHPVTVYQRGQTTFNRRFFETKLAGFLKVVPGEAEKDMVLVISSARGVHVGTRFARISPNDLTLLVVKGNASSEVVLPFAEINEVRVRHKDAA